MSIKVSFPDGSVRVFENNISVKEIAEGISHSLMKKSVVAVVNQNGVEKVVDLSTRLTADCSLKIITLDTKDTKDKQILLDTMRHSCAHLFAQTMRELYGDKVHFGFGPEVENGFYYDFELTDGTKITTEDFPKIEKKMHELAERDFEVVRKECDNEKLCDFFKEQEEEYKVEQIERLSGKYITTETQQVIEYLISCVKLRQTTSISYLAINVLKICKDDNDFQKKHWVCSNQIGNILYNINDLCFDKKLQILGMIVCYKKTNTQNESDYNTK